MLAYSFIFSWAFLMGAHPFQWVLEHRGTHVIGAYACGLNVSQNVNRGLWWCRHLASKWDSMTCCESKTHWLQEVGTFSCPDLSFFIKLTLKLHYTHAHTHTFALIHYPLCLEAIHTLLCDTHSLSPLSFHPCHIIHLSSSAPSLFPSLCFSELLCSN